MRLINKLPRGAIQLLPFLLKVVEGIIRKPKNEETDNVEKSIYEEIDNPLPLAKGKGIKGIG